MLELFHQIEAVNKATTGWCSLIKSHTLSSLVLSIQPDVTVELGVWAGKSLFPMALAHKELGKGIIWAVDPWDYRASVAGQESEQDREWWANQDKHVYAFREFEKSLRQLELGKFIHVVRSRSDDVAPPAKIGLLHADGNHGVQAIKDVDRFAPKVISGGVVVLDDIGWTGGHVEEAIGNLSQLGFKEMFRVTDENCTWGAFKRP